MTYPSQTREYINAYRKAKRDGTHVDRRSERAKPDEEKIANKQKWIADNKDRLKSYHQQYRRDHKDFLTARKREAANQAKIEGIKAYGGKCVCCGEKRIEFLTIDHIKGRQGEKKRTGKQGWLRLKYQGFPKRNIQLMCFNCNCAKSIYGACPHVKRK